MKPSEEKRVLRFLPQLIAAEGKVQKLSRWRKELIGASIGFALTPVSWVLFIEPAIYKFILFFLCFGAGIGVMIFARRLQAERQWPVLTPYLDESKLRARLNELDA